MSKGPLIPIGGAAEGIGGAFIAAWHRAEAGDRTPERSVLVFARPNGFKAALSDARVEILDARAEGPAPSITALAGRVGRPDGRVLDDGAALASTGAIRRTGRQLTLAASEATVTVADVRPTASTLVTRPWNSTTEPSGGALQPVRKARSRRTVQPSRAPR